MTRTTVIAGVVAGVGVVAVTAGLAAAVSDDLGGRDEPVRTVSIAAPTLTPTATATATGTSDDGGTRGDGHDDGHDEPDDDRPGVTAVPAGITSDQAVEIALTAVPGTIDEIYLESEDGRVVWDVDVYGADGWEHELHIDSRTGEIVKQERDDRDDD